MADLVYPPVIVVIKTFWKYLGLKFDFQGDENIPRKGGAILAINHVGYFGFCTHWDRGPSCRALRTLYGKERDLCITK